ncbi:MULTISPECIES: SusC/RagA family TonB-linked outer membrane protein [unclassified Siphonobacter]|uniref:SusC/RagA family TonB-linked outer membrane protein n=1 Tax=unclassified Siphonobacter TaxID=2635712 RepID=UPI000CC91D93|nr:MULTISPECIES: SusC/RagA family TonB-linked outer membrane protein [unclassified Siphonobacter]MDQ1088042.1 TonB-linked SusC/RagA family outer membrane protein [Siphonobacter sp. SORGH_AS_1065]MDR6194193.1 TonB-linked SusC/RagA family outer membrane protein [Siphonobacter sp. SORGH_AS_0500]PKK36984.1 SusC/RagA family TonB-linked outer membrane protein [Siphonobacter sp. SORGH_AS_0500]
MRKILLATVMLLSTLAMHAYGQDRIVIGKVTSSDDGAPIPGVNVTIKGTSRGISTNPNGEYKLNVTNNTILVFTAIGFLKQEVAVENRTEVNVTLKISNDDLQEVVVTALNIGREKKAINSAIQEVKGANLAIARNNNVADALAGKVAGVQVFSQSGAKFGTPAIRIRGVNSLTGGDPLYVVDGTVTDVNYVNMDDVESLNVLKGPAASALYGNRASAGVVVITTKKGKNQQGLGIDVNHSTTFDNVSLLPKYQNEYGGGYSQEFSKFEYNPAIHPASWASFNGQNLIDYSADESWGPRMDGTLYRPWYSWIPSDPDFGKQVPFSPQPNNVRSFFQTGATVNTNIAISKSTELFNARVSYTNYNVKGTIPNSQQHRDYLSGKLGINITPKFTANLNVNYSTEKTRNRPADGYSGQNQTIGSFNQWFQRQLDMTQLRNYKNPDGTYRSWNITGPENTTPLYWDNPYTQVYENINNEKNERLFGDFGLTYKFSEALSLMVVARRDFLNAYYDRRIASFTKGTAYYGTSNDSRREDNYETLLSYNKKFGKFTVNANAGGNIRKNTRDYLAMNTNGGLSIPNYYNIINSATPGSFTNYNSRREVRSVYGLLSLDYNDLLFIEATARNDWSSTLPVNNNSYFYPSVTAGLIFSEFLSNKRILSYGKIRGSFAQVGSDLDPYQIYTVFNTGTKYGSNTTQSIPTQLPNQNLKPGLSSGYEGGIDLKFLNNRIGLEFTVYRQDNTNQILPLAVPGSSGYSTALVNAGNIRSQGMELHINAVPVKTKDFTWDFDINLDRSRSKVVELAAGLKTYDLLQNSLFNGVPRFGGTSLGFIAREGSDWGTIVGRQFQRYQAVDANGNKIDSPSNGKILVDANGLPLSTAGQDLATVLPKMKGGFLSTFNYKGVTLRFNIDWLLGGKFYSTTRMFSAGSGISAETAGLNDKGNPKRDDPANGGGVLFPNSVKADGTPNTTYADAQSLYETRLFDLNENWIFDKTYVKLREVNLGYNLPVAWIRNTPFKTAYVAFMVRNPFLIYSKVGGGIDPSETQTFWGEGGQQIPVRSVGFNVKFGL